MKHKIVGGVTSKDEDWIIEKTLSVLDKFCDEIIVYDDGSTDNTEEISRSFDKVSWEVRPPHNPLLREEAKQRLELINLLKPKNPDYVILLDADEIPTPSIVPFLESIDDSTTWKIRMVHLWDDENHYRCDKTKTGVGVVNFNPFGNEFHGKYPLLKFDNSYPYTYNLHVQKGGCSPYHPSPVNLGGKISQTDDFYLIHYGTISEFYTSGKKHEFYSKIDALGNRGVYESRLNNYKVSQGLHNVETKLVKPEWFWV